MSEKINILKNKNIAVWLIVFPGHPCLIDDFNKFTVRYFFGNILIFFFILVPKQMDFKVNYQSAYSRCSSINGTILSTMHYLDNLVDGREYWSNIIRSMFLKWTRNESFDEICCRFIC